MVGRLAGLTAVVLTVVAGPAQAEETNYAAGIRYGGYAQTRVDLGKMLGRSHTIMARYAAKYAFMHPGAVLGISRSGAYGVGVGEFRRFQTGSSFASWDRRGKLQVKLGDRVATFVVAQDPGIDHRWVHLALVVTRSEVAPRVGARLYVNGKRAVPAACDLTKLDPIGGLIRCPDHVAGQDLQIPKTALAGVKGKLRLGQTTSRETPSSPLADLSPPTRPIFPQPGDDQFYGLIDDVAVFAHALSRKKIAGLAKARRITGFEPGLSEAYNFDRGGKRGRARPATFRNRAIPVRVAKKRRAALNLLPLAELLPPQKVAWTLPFDKGQEWYVLWGNNTSNSSHNGGASFSWDFVLAEPPNLKTCGQQLRAVAPGRVIAIDDDGIGDRPDLFRDATNTLEGRIASQERVGYLHIQTNSVRQTFTAAIPPPFIPFARGQVVARVGARDLTPTSGPTNCHLHLSSKGAGTGTIPRQFSNYERKDLKTGEWKRIVRGVPATGEIVRNPPG